MNLSNEDRDVLFKQALALDHRQGDGWQITFCGRHLAWVKELRFCRNVPIGAFGTAVGGDQFYVMRKKGRSKFWTAL